MMVSVPIDSEWTITLLRYDCIDIQISAALTAYSSANVIAVWDSASDLRVCLLWRLILWWC